MTSDIKIFGCYARHLLCCEVLVDCPPLPNSLSFWVHLVGAWNLTWYQSQRSRVRVLVEASFKSSAPFFISTFAPCSGCMWVGVLWSISGLPTSSQELKLLGSSGWCMKPNIRQVPFLACDCTLIYIVHRYILYTFVPYHTIFYKFQTNWDYNITFLDEIAGQADHEKSSYRQNKCTN